MNSLKKLRLEIRAKDAQIERLIATIITLVEDNDPKKVAVIKEIWLIRLALEKAIQGIY